LDPMTAVGALYLQIGPEEGAAAGYWAMGPEQLTRYRRAVQNDRQGATLAKLLAPLVRDGYQIISAAQLSRAPKGVDPSHPRADLLRHKGLALDFPPIPTKVRHSEALLDLRDVPEPEPGPSEVKVKVAAASINPVDWKLRSGGMQKMMPLQLPAILGRDVSGTVVKVGPGVTGFKTGDKVLGLVHHGYAE